MKKVLALFLLLQVYELHAQLAVPVVPQIYKLSCWAATLEMARKVLHPDSTHQDQCFFIRDRLGLGSDTKCSCTLALNTINPGDVETCPVDDLLVLTRKHLDSDAYKTEQTAMNISQIQFHLCIKKKPIIYYYKVGTGFDHYTIISGIYETTLNGSGVQTYWLHIKDPLVKCVGKEYMITYEKYQDPRPFGDNSAVMKAHISFSNVPNNELGVLETEAYLSEKILGENTIEKVGEKFVNSLKDGSLILSDTIHKICDLPKKAEIVQQLSLGPPIPILLVASDQRIRILGRNRLRINQELYSSFKNQHEHILPIKSSQKIHSFVSIAKRDSIQGLTGKWHLRQLNKGSDFEEAYSYARHSRNDLIVHNLQTGIKYTLKGIGRKKIDGSLEFKVLKESK